MIACCMMAMPMAMASGTGVERVLTSNDGRTVAARLVTKTEETVGIIRTADGRWFDIPLGNLSEEDREFIGDWTHSPDPAWTQAPLRRGMVQPVEGFDGMLARRPRRQPVSYVSYPSTWFYPCWRWPVYVPRFNHHWRFHQGCHSRPAVSVTIRR